MANSPSPYDGTTRFAKRLWCGALGSVPTSEGREMNVICTRHKNHLTNGKDPRKHFDEIRRRSWKD